MNAGAPYPLRNQEARARSWARRAHERVGSPLDTVDVRPGWADAATLAGAGAGAVAAVSCAAGRRWAVVPWAVAAGADALDGALARRGGGRAHGAHLDQVVDRVVDGAVCAGVVVRELRAGRSGPAGLAAVAGLAGALPSYVSASARSQGLDPGGAGPGRLWRCVVWSVAIAVPGATGPASAGIAAGSLWAAARRYQASVSSSGHGSDTGAGTALHEDAT